jgi:hypothetical protein
MKLAELAPQGIHFLAVKEADEHHLEQGLTWLGGAIFRDYFRKEVRK